MTSIVVYDIISILIIGRDIMLRNVHHEHYRNIKYCTELYHYNFNANIKPVYNPNFWACIKQSENLFEAILNHNHAEPEFIYIWSGRLYVRLGEDKLTLNPGDLLLIDPYELHSANFDREDDVEYCYLIFDFDCLAGCGSAVSDTLSSLKSGKLRFPRVVPAANPLASELGGLMLELVGLPRETDADDLLAVSILSRFMSLIFSKAGLRESDNCHDIEFISTVNEYIDANYKSNLTTASISAALGYSKGYFCALFKKNYGMTFSNYLTDYRLGAAMYDYRNSTLRLSEIAEQVGFGDYCYFSRCFRRKTGISPSQYYRGGED